MTVKFVGAGIALALLAMVPLGQVAGQPADAAAGAAPTASADPIATRKDMMKKNGDAVYRTLTRMSRGQAPFDADAASKAFSDVAAQMKVFLANFPAGSETGEGTHAKPAIWDDMAAFQALGAKEIANATAAAAASKDGEEQFKTAFRTVLQGCNTCHDKYRLPLK
jgi:cytochrome c556